MGLFKKIGKWIGKNAKKILSVGTGIVVGIATTVLTGGNVYAGIAAGVGAAKGVSGIVDYLQGNSQADVDKAKAQAAHDNNLLQQDILNETRAQNKRDIEHNRNEYKVKAEIAAMNLNATSRSDAITAFQQRSSATASMGGAGISGGTPFWALQQGIDESFRAIKENYDMGFKNLGLLTGDAQANETALESNETILGLQAEQLKNEHKYEDKALAKAKSDLNWEPLDIILDAASTGLSAYNILEDVSSLFSGTKKGGANSANSNNPGSSNGSNTTSTRSRSTLYSNESRSMALGAASRYATQPAFNVKRSPLATTRQGTRNR